MCVCLCNCRPLVGRARARRMSGPVFQELKDEDKERELQKKMEEPLEKSRMHLSTSRWRYV